LDEEVHPRGRTYAQIKVGLDEEEDVPGIARPS
jgi:hypothetical protein